MKNVLSGLGATLFLFVFIGIATATPLLLTDSNDPVLNGSTLIDFNSESLGYFSNRTFNSAVTFSGVDSGELLEISDHVYGANYGESGRYLENETTTPIRIDFVNAVSAFGFSWGAANESWVMELFDNNSNSLGVLNIAAQTSPYIGFIGGTDDVVAISSAILTANNGFDHILLDNFEYVEAGGAPAPEPATFLLFGLGILGIAGVSRKKTA